MRYANFQINSDIAARRHFFKSARGEYRRTQLALEATVDKAELGRRLDALECGEELPLHELELAPIFGGFNITPKLHREIKAFAARHNRFFFYSPWCRELPRFERLEGDEDPEPEETPEHWGARRT